jgi:hypothetical protein
MDQLECTMLVLAPAGAPAEWTDSHLVRQATALPGVRVVMDQDGAALRAIGIRTSGSTVLYNAAGEPCYYGGITPARGHEGVNLGIESIKAVIRGRQPPVVNTPVYGCLISAPNQRQK